MRAAIDGRAARRRRRLGALQPRLPAPARPRRPRQRARRGAARAHAARHRVRLPGRRDRAWPTGRGGDPPIDRCGPRRVPPPDALERRRAARRLHHRRAVAARRRRSPAARSTTQERDPASLLHALPRPDRAAPRRSAPGSSCSTRADGVLAYRRGDGTSSRSTSATEERPAPPAGELVLRHTHGRTGEAPATPRAAGRGSSPRRRGSAATPCGPGSPSLVVLLVLAIGLSACGGDERRRREHAQLLHLQRARRRPAEGRRASARRSRAASTRSSSSSCRTQRRPAARAARPPPRRRGRHDRPDRHGHHLDRRVRQRRLARRRCPRTSQAAVTENVFESVLETAKFEDKLYTVPIWSNTQLLWYRKDKVDSSRPRPGTR